MFDELINEGVGKKTEEQILQEEIIDNNILCPICGNREFVDDGIISPAYGGWEKIVYKTSYPVEAFEIKTKYCKRCGYLVMFKKF